MRSLSTLGALLVGLLVVLLHAPPAHAQGDDRERARAEFQRGVDAYGRADYQTALDAFQEAYRLAPHPMVRVNIANAYERLERPLEALVHFERFLAEGGATREQRREVEAAVRRLRAQVGELDLHVSPDGALVTIDGAEQRRAPIAEPVRVVAGEHVIDVQLEGYATERRTVTVAGGQTARVDLRLARADSVAAADPARAEEPALEPAPSEPAARIVMVEAPPQRRRDEGGFRITTPVWITGAVTLAAGIGAAVTGGLAIAANSEFEGHVRDFENPALSDAQREQARADGRAAADTASTLALVTDVLLVTTIVAGGATIFLLVTSQDGGMLAEEPQVAVVPMASDSLAGVMVLGSF